MQNLDNKLIIKVYNKADLIEEKEDKLYISALENKIEPLKEKIMEVLNLTEDNFQNPSINNARELGLLEKCRNYLISSLKANKNNVSLDLISVDLKNAYNCLLEVLGEDTNLDFTKEIFKRFCVGK